MQHPTAHKTMPYRCSGKGCRRFFSVRTGTVMADSKLGYQKWAIAVYLFNTNIKGTSSLKLHRDLGISAHPSAEDAGPDPGHAREHHASHPQHAPKDPDEWRYLQDDDGVKASDV